MALAESSGAGPPHIVGEVYLHDQKTHSERLIPFLDALVAAAAWRLEDLDSIGVVRGPGSFTGIRIGLATAQGLAKALDRPMVGLLSLDCLSWASRGWASREWASREGASREGAAGNPFYSAVILDARKNEWYAACYHWAAPNNRVCHIPPCAVAPEDFLRYLGTLEPITSHQTRYVFAGDAVLNPETCRHIARELGDHAVILPPEQALPRGSYAALEYALAREHNAATDCGPYYLRLSEAETKLPKR